MDRDLFNASTIVTVGRGDKTSFWHSSWINGTAPKNIAPSLFLKVKRKNVTVLKALQNNNWVSHVCPLLTSEEIHEYVTLWQEIRLLPRDEGADDEIIWRWTTNGEYTTSSAYRIQSMGHFKKMSITPIWKAKAESKCKIFAWILLHRKILTADNLERRGWPHDPLCKLCNSAPETSPHLCKDCPYTNVV